MLKDVFVHAGDSNQSFSGRGFAKIKGALAMGSYVLYQRRCTPALDIWTSIDVADLVVVFISGVFLSIALHEFNI